MQVPQLESIDIAVQGGYMFGVVVIAETECDVSYPVNRRVKQSAK